MKCRICEEESNLIFFTAREMVLGSRREFNYMQCQNCLTIQIVEIPSNLAEYYPSTYYSLSDATNVNRFGKLKSKLIIKRDLYILNVRKNLIGNLIHKIKPAQFNSMYLAYAFVYKELISRKNITIHDAGCGNGFFLKYFHELGYKGLSGSDPFISKEIVYNDYSVLKSAIEDIQQTFDVILLNHVIEHVIDPVQYLKAVYAKLNSNGSCLIRTPMSTSVGFEEYTNNWVGLEPPRHLHVFDHSYFQKIAESIGFTCQKIEFDAIGWHYEASEAYSKNVALNELDAQHFFKSEELGQFETMAKNANAIHRGDTVAYYLRKS